jgi:hypothetical protein
MLIKRLMFISEIEIFHGISTMLHDVSPCKLHAVTGSFHMIAKIMAVTQTR